MFKENLMSALKRAVDLYNSGSSDDQAVIKAASEYNFNPNQTQRLVETYNTAKTICMYKTAEDRTASFTLADGSNVIKALFKDNNKSVKSATLYDYSCYDTCPSFDKAAESVDFMSGINVSYNDNNHSNIIAEKLKAVDSLKMAADRAGATADMLELSYATSLNKIAAITGREKALDAISAFEASVSSDMFRSVLEDVRTKFGIDKNAELPKFTMFDVEYPEAMAEFANACDYYIKYAAYKALQCTLTKDAEEAEQNIIGIGKKEDNIIHVFTDNVKDKIIHGKTVKCALDIRDPVTETGIGIMAGLSSASKDKARAAAKRMLYSDEKAVKNLTEKAKNLHRKFLIEKLITTDPILKGMPEEDVVRAYQTVIELAPEVSLNEDVTRSILRQAANTAALAPYDAKTIVDLDTAIRNQLERNTEDLKPTRGERRENN